MTDLIFAKQNLDGHTLVLCKDGKLLHSCKRGVMPMVDYIRADICLNGFSAADTIVGKAVASMFVMCGIVAVFAKVISRQGLDYLRSHGVYVEYDLLTENIENLQGTGICPMEEAVAALSDPQDCFAAVVRKIDSMRAD